MTSTKPSILFPSETSVPSGLEEIGTWELHLPQIKIRQVRTKNAQDVPDGHWFLNSEPVGHAPERELVLLSVRKERSLLLPHEGGAAAAAARERIKLATGVAVPAGWEGPVCFSRNRVLPVLHLGVGPLASACFFCPMSRSRIVDGRPVQDCAESLCLLLFDLAAEVACVFYARGLALRPAQNLLAALKVACLLQKRPQVAFSVRVSTRRLEGSGGPYFVPVFGRPELLADGARVAFLSELRQTCLDQVEEV